MRRGAVELEETLKGTRLTELSLGQLVVVWELGKGCRAGGVCWRVAQDVYKGGRPTPSTPYRCFLNVGCWTNSVTFFSPWQSCDQCTISLTSCACMRACLCTQCPLKRAYVRQRVSYNRFAWYRRCDFTNSPRTIMQDSL